MLSFFDNCYYIRHSPLIGIGSNQPLITMAQQQQQQLLEGISFQIDNVTFSHHLASFN
jgi:hypothetical protein